MEIFISRKDALAQGLSHYFSENPCVHGHMAKRRIKDRVCTECDKRNKEKLRNGPENEKLKEVRRASYRKNVTNALLTKKKYREANKGKIMALVTARKQYVKLRTPKWLTSFDKLRIRCIYQVSAMRTRETGEQWHVDHIIPLQGKTVSGLHVPNNLRVILASENISKKNKFEVCFG
jgi:hypothetical protein